MNRKPNLFVSDTERNKPEFCRELTDYIISAATTIPDIVNIYSTLNGILPNVDYNYVLNPYNVDDVRLSNYPGELRNYDIIMPIVRRYMGENLVDIRNFEVVSTNDDEQRISALERQKLGIQALSVMLQKSLYEKGLIGNEPNEEPPIDVEQYIQQNLQTTTDKITSSEQDVLDYIIYNTKSEELYMQAYFNWLVYDSVISFREVVNDDIKKEIIHPYHFGYLENGLSEYIEDKEGAFVKYKLSLQEIITKFRHVLNEKDIKYLRNLDKSESGYFSKPDSLKNYFANLGLAWDNLISTGNETFLLSDNNLDFDVYRIQIKLPIQINILRYRNEIGEVKEMEVPQDYEMIIGRDIDLNTDWIYKTFEAYRFGAETTGIYTKFIPIIAERSEMNNSAKCKLGFNGKIRMFYGAPSHSLVKILLPYQKLYNIYQLHRERLINKLDSFSVIPKGSLSNDEFGEDTAIYHIKADGRLYLDETNPNFAKIIEGFKTITIGSADMIILFDRLLQSIKEEAWDVVDMNRQRFGETMASDGKAVTEQSIARVSLGSLMMSETFNKYLETEYQADIDYSKYAWLRDDPIYEKGKYINSEGRVSRLIINPRVRLYSDIKIFVKNSRVEKEKYEAYKAFAFNAGQNGSLKVAIESVDKRNSSKLRDLLMGYIDEENQRLSAMEEARNNLQKEVAQMNIQQSDKELSIKLQIELAKIEKDIEVAKMKLTGMSKGVNEDGTDLLTVLNDIEMKIRDLNIKQDSNNIKREQMRSNEKIARMNKN